MAKSTTWKTYEAELEYAQLFERNMDKGNDDSDAGRTIAAKGGQTKVTMLITEDVKDQMIADGVPLVSMGYDMFKHDPERDLFRYVAKRPWNSPFKDEDTGKIKPFGEPNVVDYPASVAAMEVAKETGESVDAVQWDPSVNIGNGSLAKVKLSIYQNGSKRIIRLEGVAVVEHVAFESEGFDGVRF
tara:strand:+ start:174 stop:731 length:558 start_codon:yes stop_codon:yes gene_type:complete